MPEKLNKFDTFQIICYAFETQLKPVSVRDILPTKGTCVQASGSVRRLGKAWQLGSSELGVWDPVTELKRPGWTELLPSSSNHSLWQYSSFTARQCSLFHKGKKKMMLLQPFIHYFVDLLSHFVNNLNIWLLLLAFIHAYTVLTKWTETHLQTGLGAGPNPDGLQSGKEEWQSSERTAGLHSVLSPSSSVHQLWTRYSCMSSGSEREELKKTSKSSRRTVRHTSPRYALQ